MDTLNKIKQLLKANNLKQKDLTDYLCISKNAFTNWSNGSNSSYIKHLPQIAEFFNVSIDYLAGREEIKEDSLALNYGESPTKYKIKELIDTILEKTDDEEELNALRIVLEKFTK